MSIQRLCTSRGKPAARLLFATINITLLVATFGSALGAQLGAARLLYGMGRSKALPNSFFGALDPVRRIPRNNVLGVGLFALVGALLISFERGVELLNFGALLAFMGVNAAAMLRFYVREPNRRWFNLVSPALGFLICLALWLSLSWHAKVLGVVWMAAGIAYGAYNTRGFKRELVNFDLPSGESEAS